MKQDLLSKRSLNDLLDTELLEEYINQIHEYVKVPITLFDRKGEIVVASKWTEFCNDFARKDPKMGMLCKNTCSRISDSSSNVFSCPNGLMMYKFPIKIKNDIVAYLVLSQFLTEKDDKMGFMDKLEKKWEDNEGFRIAADKIPVLNSSEIEDGIAFLNNFVILLHDIIDRRLKAIELEEEVVQNYEELEASYQDVSELNDKLNLLNSELLEKNSVVAQSEARYRSLIEKMNQGVLILSKQDEIEGFKYEVVDLNLAMKMIMKSIEELKCVPIEMFKTYKIIDFILNNAEKAVCKKSKKIYYNWENKRYFSIEYEKLTDFEIMVCVSDVTIMHEKFQNQRKQVWGIVTAMGKLVEKRDLYTSDHQKKVAMIATRIAYEFGLSIWQIESVFIAAMLHDIGKISIPSEILAKPSNLTEIEYALIKTHVNTAYDILKGIDFKMPIADIVNQHHEKLNGTGYPNGISGEEIRIEAKIIAVADVYEAMTSHRPYRPSLGEECAINHLIENKNIFYDSQVVDICVKIANEEMWDISEIKRYLAEQIARVEDYHYGT